LSQYGYFADKEERGQLFAIGIEVAAVRKRRTALEHSATAALC